MRSTRHAIRLVSNTSSLHFSPLSPVHFHQSNSKLELDELEKSSDELTSKLCPHLHSTIYRISYRWSSSPSRSLYPLRGNLTFRIPPVDRISIAATSTNCLIIFDQNVMGAASVIALSNVRSECLGKIGVVEIGSSERSGKPKCRNGRK